MKKVLLGITIVIGAGILFGILWASFQPNSIRHIATWGSRYYAKEVCTCLFVLEKNWDFCKEETANLIPMGQVKIDYDAKTVWSEKFGLEATSKFQSEQLGCRMN